MLRIVSKSRHLSCAANRPFAVTGYMEQNLAHWRAKECDKSPLGSVNKEKSTLL